MYGEVQFDGEALQEYREDREVPCQRLIGCAGTGKTFTLMARTREDPTYGLLTATTGIASVNLGTVTINSVCRYYDTASLRDIYLTGRLTRTLHDVALRYRRLIIEEYSMAEGAQLDLWYRGVQEANRNLDVVHPLGILLVGDLAQLPPVSGDWVFHADCWPRFAEHTERLEHVYRQDGGPFLDALNLLRAGQGGPASEVLLAAGATWHTQLDSEFDGTTILPVNENVRRYNEMALDRVPGPRLRVLSRRWGQQRPEWGENQRTHEWGIAPVQEFKIGALVMLLANTPDFTMVNGDTGHIVSFDNDVFTVHLLRTDADVELRRIVRHVDQSDRPDDWQGESIHRIEDEGGYIPQRHYRGRAKKYVLGQVEWHPMRLAAASTVHKTQSLTLDRIQVDVRHWTMNKPSMVYVAFSRVRTLEGLRIVGSKDRFIKQCTVAPEVQPWL
jgi:ATP-dependent DNA helicase PIF1